MKTRTVAKSLREWDLLFGKQLNGYQQIAQNKEVIGVLPEKPLSL